MARAPGTFYMLDKPETDELLKRLPAKEGILLYLLLKRSFRLKGATADELVKALGCALKTLDTALRALKKKNEIVQKGERFFRTDSSSSVPDVVPTSVPNSRKSPAIKPEQDGLFEEHEVRGRTLKSLSRVEELENQKLELLQSAFGDDFKLIDEVEGRRDAWLGLSPETIADATLKVTGFENFRTALKRELDKLANVTPPQSARGSGRREIGPNGPDMGRNRTPRRDAPDPNHSGAKPLYDEVMTQKARQAELDQRQSAPDYASMSSEAFEALVARNRHNQIGASMRQIREQQLEDKRQRNVEQQELSRRQQLWRQAQEMAEGGHVANALDPPNDPATSAKIEPGGLNHADALPPTPRRAGPSSLRPQGHRRGTPGAISGAGGGGPP